MYSSQKTDKTIKLYFNYITLRIGNEKIVERIIDDFVCFAFLLIIPKAAIRVCYKYYVH